MVSIGEADIAGEPADKDTRRAVGERLGALFAEMFTTSTAGMPVAQVEESADVHWGNMLDLAAATLEDAVIVGAARNFDISHTLPLTGEDPAGDFDPDEYESGREEAIEQALDERRQRSNPLEDLRSRYIFTLP